MINNEDLGRILKEVRLSRGLKKYQLGRKINKTSDSIKKYENGYTTVPLNVLQDICAALSCELEISLKTEQKHYSLK